MYILQTDTEDRIPVGISLIEAEDWEQLTVADFFFDWKRVNGSQLWKLTQVRSPYILGVMSLIDYPVESRIEIHLLASRRQAVGQGKKYSRIAGCLMAWACRLAVQRYAQSACVSLIPKTELRHHYRNAYGMMDAGWQLFLEDAPLYDLLKKYLYDES